MPKLQPTHWTCSRTVFALFVLLLGLSGGWAAPFKKIINFRQPDGSLVQISGVGDEFYAEFETLEGYSVVFDQSLKAYCFARLSEDGSQLLSTGVQVQAGTPESLGLTPHLRISEEARREQVAQRYAVWDGATGLSGRWQARKQLLSAPSPSDALPGPPGGTTVGTKVGLTLLIDFDDDVATIAQTDIADFCNGDSYKQFGNNGSVKAFYAYVSNGKLTYTNVVTAYVRAPHPKTYYNDTSKDAGLQARMLISDALTVLTNQPTFATDLLPQLSALTKDKQNQAVAFNVFYAGDNGGVWSMGLWPHSWALAAPFGLSANVKVLKYQVSNIGDQLEIGTFCHENGHMLCDFPDLYDYTYSSSGAGDWCLMAGGSWGGSASNPGNNPAQVCAYLKRAAGWAKTIDLTSADSLIASVSVDPGTNFNVFYRYAKPGTATEYYLAECRSKTNHDASLPGSGVAVWHIDERGDNSSVNLNPNTSHNNYEATLVQADNLWQLEKGRNSGDAKDLYYQGNTASGYANQLTDISAPKAQWWDGSASGLAFRKFSKVASSMTFLVGTNDPAPVILTQPTNVTVLMNLSASFSVGVGGFNPFAYQWRKNGALIPNASNSSFTVASAQMTDAGNYSVVVTNDYGAITSAVAVLTVIPTVPLAFALNNSNLNWTADPAIPWYGQTNLSFDGVAAGRSYFIGDGQQTSLTVTTNGPATLCFWWKVSSQTNADFLRFSSSAGSFSNSLQISGEVGWQSNRFYLPAGPLTLKWTYSKDGSGKAGQDAAWLDQVSFVAGGTAPLFVSQPANKAVPALQPVTFNVIADGTPSLAYQWFFNDTPIAGAKSNSLTLPSPTEANSGFYAVEVSNAYGTNRSNPALLSIVPFVVSGDNSFGQLDVSPLATNAVAVAAGAWHSVALRADGSVCAWGEYYDGQCDVPASPVPAMAVAAGGYHSLALLTNGTVLGWGADYYGEATPPAGLSNVVAIAAGSWHSLALRADGSVLAWGDNTFGQSEVPAGLSNVLAIAAGGNHNLALRANGTVVAWGENTDALGQFAGQCTVPSGLSNVVAIAAGEYHSLALRADGSLQAWGDNSKGQLAVPAGLTNEFLLAGGGGHSVALAAGGIPVAWGNNWNGQCAFPPAIPKVIAVAAGSAHTLLLVGSSPTAPTLCQPSRNGNQFKLLVQTILGRNYALEYNTSLSGGSWNPVCIRAGNGALQELSERASSGPQRFYRVRVW